MQGDSLKKERESGEGEKELSVMQSINESF